MQTAAATATPDTGFGLALATVEALGHAGTVSAHVAVKSWADNLTSNGTLKFEAEKAGERIARTAQEQ